MAHLTLSPLERSVLQLLLDDDRVWLTASELTAAEYQRLHRRWMDLAGRDQLRLGA